MSMAGLFLIAGWLAGAENAGLPPRPLDYYLGIWYANQPTQSEYAFKYSGGLATYTADHIPMAVYAPEVKKTFFVYGGRLREENTLAEMISYYDHETHTLPQPYLLRMKGTDDAHDNPALSIDDQGYLWVFISSHGTARPSYLVRSLKPYDIGGFETVLETNFSYPQPWHVPGKGFLFLHTRYTGGRALHWQTSPDGREWSKPKLLSLMDEGHYQVSWPWKDRVGTAFNYHPKGKGLNYRTNIYYVATGDFGNTWQNVRGETLDIPLRDKQCPALVHDYEAEGLKAYLCDVNYDAAGQPLILHVVSRGWEPGPEHGPQRWRIAQWTGEAWRLVEVGQSDNNYDMGSLYVMPDGRWRVLGPLDAGPQPYNPGGEMVLLESADEGASWQRTHQITSNSEYNHTYARRPLNVAPGFMSFWADGDCRKPSLSRLYFWDDIAGQAYQMPDQVGVSGTAALPVFSTKP